ncbi:hypothetical protein [Periweissella ghanensis]|uniref:Uncharacterized protein n=1 Tax=Periweissella ghanensis TaxID=467997 RepID=A0ABM8ZA96_9LACO|nr:hypothetical protein [Periweissella ghanensis]MCM0600435.1 hypothetical protein [Periweissella ghanensis]CAH0418101.1 hypothetical protein WGH24286_00517 [Periweissella ghanensis]
MDFIILLGIIIIVLGVLVMMVTPRERTWGSVYRSKNPAMAATAVILIIIGLVIVILKAWLNGQVS